MPEYKLFGLALVIILVLMFILIVIRLNFIMTPQITGGWLTLLIDYVLRGLWPIR
jgi:hypothetical protein